MGVSTDDNGLYYMRQRYYNPEIKRFVNQDILTGSIGNSQSLNRYCYVQGNPVSYVDPFGLSPMAALQQAGQVALGVGHVILGGLSIIPTPVGIVAGALDAVLYAFLDHDIYAAATSGLGALGMGFGNIAGMAMGGSKLSVSAAVAEVLCDVAGGVVSFNDPRNAGDNNTLETFGTVALVAVLGTVGATVGSKMFGKNAGRAIDNVMDEVVEHSDDAGRVFSKVDDVAMDVARTSNKSNSGSSNHLAYNLQLFGGGTSSGRDASGRLNISQKFFGSGGSQGNSSSKLYMNGDAGELELERMFGGKRHAYFKTSLGARFVDQWADGVAHESKVGYTTLSKRIKIQILKDAELIRSGDIDKAHWHFFKSGVTGKGGASKPLLKFLTENGIEYTIH